MKTELKEKKMEEEISGLKDDECFWFLSSVRKLLDDEMQIAQEDMMALPYANVITVRIGDVSEFKEDKETKRNKEILE